MDTIQRCSKCWTLEFDWWPEDEIAEDQILPYICRRCVDQWKTLIALKWVMVLHRTWFPPEVFHFLFPNNWAQCSYLKTVKDPNVCRISNKLLWVLLTHTERHLQSALYARRTDSSRTSLEGESLQNNMLGSQYGPHRVLVVVFDLRQHGEELPCIT